MKSLFSLFLFATCSFAAAGNTLTPASGSVGHNLQTYATVALSAPADSDVTMTVTSSDPSRLLIAKHPEAKGTASITVTVRAKYRESPEFWLQALGSSGDVPYSVTIPGFEPGKGTVTLAPSGIAISGPNGANIPVFTTTPRSWPSKLAVKASRLDPSLKPVESQYVRGGYSLEFDVVSSSPAVGTLSPSKVSIGAATDSATLDFVPAKAGVTTIAAVAPAGFHAPANMDKVVATVKMPGIAVANDEIIGQNLQFVGSLSLGEQAPEGGLLVTLTSAKPDQMLLSETLTGEGKGSITIRMPAGSVNRSYYLQALGNSGEVTHTASAEGFATRTGTLTLAPSGVIMMPAFHGAPDEAELFRPQSAGADENPFVSKLSDPKGVPLAVFTAYLDPRSKRSADITVQALRGGFSVPVAISNADPSVGTVETSLVLQGGTEKSLVTFKPVAVGKTRIKLATPAGFTTPSNATALLAIVR